MRPFCRCQCQAFYTPHMLVFLVFFYSQCLPRLSTLYHTAVCAEDRPTQVLPRLLCILAVSWIHQTGEARRSEGRKEKGQSVWYPILPPLCHRPGICCGPHSSHSDLLALPLGCPAASRLQQHCFLTSDSSLGSLHFYPLHVSSLLLEPNRLSTALVFLLSGEDFAMAIAPK